MDLLPAGIAAQSAILRQNVAMSVIKQGFEQQQALAGILQESIENVNVSSTRGTKHNSYV